MNFIFTGKNMEVSDGQKERLKKKLSKFEKFFNDQTDVHATFKSEKNNKILEVTIPFNGVTYRAEEKNDNMYASIDKIVDILDGQIRRNKTNVSKKVKGLGMKNLFGFTKSAEKSKENKISEIRKYSMKPMTTQEAMMQLKLQKEDFFMFINSEEKCVNLVYKLNDGSYGMIEPGEE